MNYTITITPHYDIEHGDYNFIAQFDHHDCSRLTNNYVQHQVIGYGLTELEAINDLLMGVSEALRNDNAIKINNSERMADHP